MSHTNNFGIHRTSQYTSNIHILSPYLSATIVTQGSVKSSQLQNTTIRSYFLPLIPVPPVSKHVHASELTDKSVYDCRKELEEVRPQYHLVPTAHSCISIKSPLYLLPIYILSSNSNSRVISADHLLVPVILLYAAVTLMSLSCHSTVLAPLIRTISILTSCSLAMTILKPEKPILPCQNVILLRRWEVFRIKLSTVGHNLIHICAKCISDALTFTEVLSTDEYR